jgi:hypothetical protein
MLMTKFTYTVELKEDGLHTIVTRLSDSDQKHFFQCVHRNKAALEKFMDSITDDLAEGYWPRERTKGKKNGS